MDAEQARRRIDRIAAPGYLEDLQERDVVEVRRMRDECRAEEEHLSYARRVLQGQLDVARSEAASRTDDSEGNGESLLARLPSILADPPTSRPRDARSVTFHLPDMSGNRAGDLDAPGVALSRIPDLSDADLADLVSRLMTDEQRVSEARRLILDRLDALQAELVRRYREGSVAIDELVSPSGDDGA